MRKNRHLLRVLFAGLVLATLALLDFVSPSGTWYANHPMTASAVAAALGFVAAGVFLEGWMREREASRLTLISTVAYRSLAQQANDAGRSLLATLTGADLTALGIPGGSIRQTTADRRLLERRGHASVFEEQTGSWRQPDRARLDAVLTDLLRDPVFVRRLFRRTSLARRRLQDATAHWAPVMLTSARYADDLGKLRELTDALELLQERLRLSGLIGRTRAEWQTGDEWVSTVSRDFWSAIEVYGRIRDAFGDLAALPSDTIVNRRATLMGN